MDIKSFTRLFLLTSSLGSSLITFSSERDNGTSALEEHLANRDNSEENRFEEAFARAILQSRLVQKGLYNKENSSKYVTSLSYTDIKKLNNFLNRDKKLPYLGRVLSDEGIMKAKEVIAWTKLQNEVERATGTITWGMTATTLNEENEVVRTIIANNPLDLEGKRSDAATVMRSIILRNIAEDKEGKLTFKELISKLHGLNSNIDWEEVYRGKNDDFYRELMDDSEGYINPSHQAISWAREIESSGSTIAWAVDAEVRRSDRTIAWVVNDGARENILENEGTRNYDSATIRELLERERSRLRIEDILRDSNRK
ncbi:hypothetical protein A9Q84_03130 [Halobacteriovorax marinus]|uniref:Uncharacterized protein n=1 Tax=Halobacteriovorax marinus TaxID=97084 RepID=A0A1Y5FCW3_9BACT|nr:hypothetical protein A9Q84_03130 [Halobacteriovorax marinus]